MASENNFIKSVFSIKVQILFQIQVIVFWLLVHIPNSFSQGNKFSFSHLSLEQGLNQSRQIMYLNKDTRGFTWIGTLNGVNRYDGLHMEYYPLNQDSVTGSLVQSNFFEDTHQNIWFTSYKGIYSYVRDKNKFNTYRLLNEEGEFIDEGYRIFHIDNKLNELWLKAGENIFLLDLEDPSNYSKLPISTKGEFFYVDTTSQGIVERIFACPWIKDFGFELIQKKNEEWLVTDHLEELVFSGDTLRPKVSQVIIKNDSSIWLVSDVGLLELEKNEVKFINRYSPPSNEVKFMHGLFADSHNLLLSSYNHGIWIFDSQNRNFINNLKNSSDDAESIRSDNIMALYQDPQDHIWVSHHQEGVDYLNFAKQDFTDLLSGEIQKPSFVKFIQEDNKKRIWVATRNQGIFVFDKNGQFLLQFKFGVNEKSKLNIDNLQHLSVDENGRVWCFSREHMYVFENENWKEILNFKDLSVYETGNRNKKEAYEDIDFQFLSLLPNGKDNYYLVTNSGIKNLFYDGKKTQISTINEFSSKTKLIYSQIFEHSQNNFFIPFYDEELWNFQKENSLWSKNKIRNAKGYYYKFSLVRKDKLVFAGTTNGLLEINENFKTQYTFNYPWQLGNQPAYGLVEDHNGNWWIPTNRGLFAYYHKDQQLIHYKKEDGLPEEEYSPFAMLKASDNKLWFGHKNGLTVFHPDSINYYPHSPNVHIRELRINNIPYEGEITISEAKELELSPTENTLSFDLVAVTNYLPKLAQLRYRLIGYDEEWNLVDNGGTIHFTKVPSGNYELEIIAMNSNGVESKMKKLQINIATPLHLRAWFIGLLVLLAIGITWIIAFFYRKRKEKIQQLEFEKLLALEQERLRIARDMHDDLGSGLSALNLFVEMLNQRGINTNLEKELHKIGHSTKELTQKMREVIWTVNVKNDWLEKLTMYLHQYASELFDSVGMDYKIDIPQNIPSIKIPGEHRRMLFLSYKEAINNAIKWSKATHLFIRFSIVGEQLVISIQDNGQGFDPQLITTATGIGLKSMQQRMTDIGGTCKIETGTSGSTIFLSLPL